MSTVTVPQPDLHELQSKRRPYLVFRDTERLVVSMLGPYLTDSAARQAMLALLEGDEKSLTGLDLDSVPPSAQCLPSFYASITLIQLTPEEVEKIR